MGGEGQAGTDLRERAVKWLVALDCGTADVDAFEEWRSASPHHASAFAQVAATWRRTADPQIASVFRQPAETRTVSPPASEPVVPRTVTRRAMVASGVMAAIGLAGASAFLALPSRASASTGVGERRTIPLPDGSHAMLNTDSRVSWRFDGSREFWIERGEVALLVRDGTAAFRLHSDPIDARLSNGSFNIRLETEGGQLLVLAGQAMRDGGDAVRAGTMLTVRDGIARTTTLPADEVDAATAWQQGRILFNGMPLARAISEFNRYLPDPIVIEDPSLASTQLGGAFRIDDPDGFLTALQNGFDIGHRRTTVGHILLYRNKRA